jgi:membrane fusion protein (multidrug efflux system)
MMEDTHAPNQPAAVEQSKSTWRKYISPVVVLLLAGVVIFTILHKWNTWEGGRSEQNTDDAYVRADLTPIGTKVAGIVRAVRVSDYQQVHKGDVLVELEDADYNAQVAQATAAIEAAQAAMENNRQQRALQDTRIQRTISGIDQAHAQMASALAGKAAIRADVSRTQAERTRQESLLKVHASTQQKVEGVVADEERFTALAASRDADFSLAKALLRSSELAVEGEQRGKLVLESQEAQLIADLHAKQAGLELARVNRGYTRIVAPAEGTVGERQVRPGQLVSPGMQVITFVEHTKWVQANFRETQLTNIKVGDPVEIRIDVYPGQIIHGQVLQIAPASGSQFALLPPDNATGNFTKVVQRVPVKISLEDSTLTDQLRPGLSADVAVHTKRQGNLR